MNLPKTCPFCQSQIRFDGLLNLTFSCDRFNNSFNHCDFVGNTNTYMLMPYLDRGRFYFDFLTKHVSFLPNYKDYNEILVLNYIPDFHFLTLPKEEIYRKFSLWLCLS